jgi:hypothetical protein
MSFASGFVRARQVRRKQYHGLIMALIQCFAIAKSGKKFDRELTMNSSLNCSIVNGQGF